MAWSVTSVISLFSFGVALVFAAKINRQYGSILSSTSDEYADWYNDANNYNEDCGGQEGEDGEDGSNSNDKEGCGSSNDYASYSAAERMASIANVSSRGMAFAGAYSAALGLALGMYGTTVVVGFTTLKGEYVPPCFTSNAFSPHYNSEGDHAGYAYWDGVTGPKKFWGAKVHRGIFFGCLVMFSNLLLVCAVVFGEFQVFDSSNNNGNNQGQNDNGNNYPPYRIEKVSAVFASTCIILAVVYLLFAIVYLSCGGTSSDLDEFGADGYDADGMHELSSVGGGIGVGIGVGVDVGHPHGFMRADDRRYNGGGREHGRRSMGGTASSGGDNTAESLARGGGGGTCGFGFSSPHPSDEDRTANRGIVTNQGGFITQLPPNSSSNSEDRW